MSERIDSDPVHPYQLDDALIEKMLKERPERKGPRFMMSPEQREQLEQWEWESPLLPMTYLEYSPGACPVPLPESECSIYDVEDMD